MIWLEYPLIGLGLALLCLACFAAGGLLAIKVIVDMHNSSLPPSARPESIFSIDNLSPGTACALACLAAVVLAVGSAAAGWFARQVIS